MPVPGLIDAYEVSSEGRVKSLSRRIQRDHGNYLLTGRILKDTKAGKGYRRVRIGGNDRYIHRLVLEAFVGPCPPGMECCHNNGNPADNRLENLRYDTSSNNNRDKNQHGTNHNANKTRCTRGHEYTDQNTIQRSDGGRRCRTCHRDKSRRAMQKKLSTQEGRAAAAVKMREWRRRTGKVDGLGNQWARRTHCNKGHEFTPENTLDRSDGGRRCRTCQRGCVNRARTSPLPRHVLVLLD